MGALDMTYSDVMNGDVPKPPARNPVALNAAAAGQNPLAQSLQAAAAVAPKPAAPQPSIPPAAPNPTLMPVPPGIARNTAANPNPMAPPATLADIRTPNGQAQPMQAVTAAPAAPAQPAAAATQPAAQPAAQQPTDPDIVMINGIRHQNTTPQTRNPLMIGAAASNAAEILVPKPFENRAAATLAANRAGLNTEGGEAPAANPMAKPAAAPANPAGTTAGTPATAPSLDERQAGYMIDNNLRQFEDKGNGIVRQVGANGKTEFTNVGTSGVTDPTKSVQVNSYNGAADNASLAKANSIRQEMIDRQPQGGVAIMADYAAPNPNGTTVAELQSAMKSAGTRTERAAYAQAMQAAISGQNQLTQEAMRQQGVAAGHAVQMRGQDMNAQAEAARLAGNPLNNELTKTQIAAGKMANDKTKAHNDAWSKIQTETDPVKRGALIDSLLASQGKNPAEHRYVKVDGGEEIGPDGVTKIKKPSGVFDVQTRQFIPMGPQGATTAASAAPHPDGTRLIGPDKKTYVVKNGQPVLEQ